MEHLADVLSTQWSNTDCQKKKDNQRNTHHLPFTRALPARPNIGTADQMGPRVWLPLATMLKSETWRKEFRNLGEVVMSQHGLKTSDSQGDRTHLGVH